MPLEMKLEDMLSFQELAKTFQETSDAGEFLAVCATIFLRAHSTRHQHPPPTHPDIDHTLWVTALVQKVIMGKQSA